MAEYHFTSNGKRVNDFIAKAVLVAGQGPRRTGRVSAGLHVKTGCPSKGGVFSPYPMRAIDSSCWVIGRDLIYQNISFFPI